MDENRFYTIKEIKEILKDNERLVYIDDGIDEAIFRYEDLADAIVEISTMNGLKDLKVYEYEKNTMQPIVITKGYYLDKCDPDVRKDIIDRLNELQMGGAKIKPYKIIDEDLLDEAVIQLSEEQVLKVVYKEIGKDPVVKEIKNTLEAKQELVGGLIETVPYKEDEELILICNEEGKINNLELNIDMGFDYIAGNCFVIGDDYENGDFKSVPEDKIESVIKDLKSRAVVIDKYMNRDKTQTHDLTKEQSRKEIR